MNLLIKLLVFSAPFVVFAVLFWPDIEQKLQPPPQEIITEDPLLKPSSLIENYKPNITSQKIASRKKSSSAVKSNSSKIYRWVDDKGQTHFSDKPSHNDAVAHTPKKLSSIIVSDDIKQRVAVEEHRAAKRVDVMIAESSYPKADRAKRKPEKSYKYSNVSAGQKHGYILMSGRISGGSTCKQLRVTAYAQSDRGRSASGSDDIRMSGSGSRLFEMKVDSHWKGGGNRRPQWEITGIDANCLSW